MQCIPSDGLHTLIRTLWEELHNAEASLIDSQTWEDSAYRPTPTIIDAARLLYDKHDVRELGLAGASNLDVTVSAVLELVDLCRREHKRGIAFITGAPGSGKTLAGLQIVHTPALITDRKIGGVFLSGNMPLVEVISQALVDSAARATGRPKVHIKREVSTFIQHAFRFRNEYAETQQPPSEHIVLFDEAQRAWDAKRVTSWTRGASTRSEPRILLDVMSRAPGWSVIIALIGSGQEINSGEAGIAEWGRALSEFHPDWIVRAAPAMLPGAAPPPGGLLFDQPPDGDLQVVPDARLHLTMNVRSPRAERLNQWVDHLLNGNIEAARGAFPDGAEFPIALTRSLDSARQWLRDRTDEDHRSGLVTSAEARRLRAWGLETNLLRTERAWPDWYLKPRGDVRGSDQLEVPATNFDCQGLEIDWVGVCWGNDFSHTPERGWRARHFSGSRWTNVNEERARYILNGYRVLLTRARRGQVIWVPEPDGSDATLDPADFEATANLLRDVGVPSID